MRGDKAGGFSSLQQGVFALWSLKGVKNKNSVLN